MSILKSKEVVTTPRSKVSSISPSWGTMVVIDDGHPLINTIEHHLLLMMTVSIGNCRLPVKINAHIPHTCWESQLYHYATTSRGNINKMLLGCPWNLVTSHVDQQAFCAHFSFQAFGVFVNIATQPPKYTQPQGVETRDCAFHSSGGL